MRVTAWRLIVTALLGSSACSAALHPHRTLEGRPFSWHEVKTLAPGDAEAEVLERVGQPFEVREQGPGEVVWLYHERARLHGCRTALFGVIPWGDSPVVTVDARVQLRDGVVVKVETSRRE